MRKDASRQQSVDYDLLIRKHWIIMTVQFGAIAPLASWVWAIGRELAHDRGTDLCILDVGNHDLRSFLDRGHVTFDGLLSFFSSCVSFRESPAYTLPV
jgi:hypothetical protein